MCGIIMAISNDGHIVNEEVYNQFQDQSGRGVRGFGIAMLEEGKNEGEKPFIKIRRSTDEVGAICDLKLFESKTILFHHRTPTSSDNKIQQTHPILVSNDIFKYDWLVAHNGIIHNANELKKAHEVLGIKYSTDDGSKFRNYNDSEALATDIALFFEREHLKKTFGFDKTGLEAKGSIALMGMQLAKGSHQPICAFYGRNNGNPLKVTRDQRVIFISSEGKGELVETDKITIIDLLSPANKQKTYDLVIPYDYNSSNASTGNVETNRAAIKDYNLDREWTAQNSLNEGAQDPLEDDETTKDEFAHEFNFTTDADMLENADNMYEELETLCHQFIETVCNKDGVSFAGQYISDARKAMEGFMEKMETYWDEAKVLEAEDALVKQNDAAIVEATRDGDIQVVDKKHLEVIDHENGTTTIIDENGEEVKQTAAEELTAQGG